ncbi:hypothetical protein [Proteiniphilum sp. UBA5463]|jgi:hypothetical protein|uniref:hypothetical protein n=1 Tax=Proteiniphilum sp. UBA5463 TaxID=1947281 RepID=UPI00257D3C82|nr:hypothetical protein [Proteiniphilum sp. UBA5463]
MNENFEQKKNEALNKTDVSGSLPYNEKVLMHLWYSRNPSHEINTNTEEDMFWKTVFMVMKDYIREVWGNNR